jgi:hypothetical protein
MLSGFDDRECRMNVGKTLFAQVMEFVPWARSVGAPTSRCGSGGAIPNPRRKPIFGVVGLMYKRWRTLQMVR